MVAVSAAPCAKIADYRRRMGWTFKWVSSAGSRFNGDYHVAFTPEELAAGRGFYNYTVQDRATRSGKASASSTATRRERCSTPTRPMRAESTR